MSGIERGGSWAWLMWLAAEATAAPVLVVGTEFANVFEKSASGEYVGLGVDILRAIAKQRGDNLNFEIYPWPRAQLMVENHQAQILIGPYKTPEREAKFVFARRAFYRDQMVFYVRAGAGQTWDGRYASLQGARIGVINGWVYGPQFESMRAMLKPEVANSLTIGLNMLMAHRFDLLASNMRNTEALARKLNIENDLAVIEPVMDVQDGYMAFCKQSACDALRQYYDDAFDTLRDSGELARMARKYNVRLP
ncbi:substrate-binding periplasmic protein [Parachitinimonas caeni]|uniref:Transporter substrate-binding domain-containing protein n=1 Tax=Parachitinimonas caeni TaxID=3031301 RepID=A0ABT7E2Y9_9NEIS|nr:transporter substrate-binding domain-containing protein [Parachitinimonas caeni]MDK2126614.1 transporter substrate-binding domain-containing protein [Parachitinimonas caeni]